MAWNAEALIFQTPTRSSSASGNEVPTWAKISAIQADYRFEYPGFLLVQALDPLPSLYRCIQPICRHESLFKAASPPRHTDRFGGQISSRLSQSKGVGQSDGHVPQPLLFCVVKYALLPAPTFLRRTAKERPESWLAHVALFRQLPRLKVPPYHLQCTRCRRRVGAVALRVLLQNHAARKQR